ncbi:hypothetical protein POM88_009484 [Heracleum sosnowskyi]|uniref:Uncharacterized protein n=1 Tax=Heracleum sosnowskyi TaxID=360622 RepID=A0AAD8J9H5_9APIA|nr:hypothetical protein POM88_009484 [Heracleum sosnowskyi]
MERHSSKSIPVIRRMIGGRKWWGIGKAKRTNIVQPLLRALVRRVRGKKGHKPPRDFWYKKLHSKKVEGVPIDELLKNVELFTDESQKIETRYADIVDRNRDVLANMPDGVESAEHPLQWWLEAVAPGMSRPPKNELVGFPRIPASSLLPDLATNYRARRGDDDRSSSQGVGGSQVPDAIFFKVVRSIMKYAQANPTAYHMLPTYDQINAIASAALEMQRNPESGAEAFSNAVRGEVTRYVGTILTSIYKKYETEHQAAIKRAQQDDDSTTSNIEDGSDEDGGEEDDSGEE